MKEIKNLCLDCITPQLADNQDYPLVTQFTTGVCDVCGVTRGIASTNYIREVDQSIINWVGNPDRETAQHRGYSMYIVKVVEGEKKKWCWGLKDATLLHKGEENTKKLAKAELMREYNKLVK